MLDSNLQQSARGTRGLPAPLLPVLKRPRRHPQQLRELLLRQADAGSCFGRRRRNASRIRRMVTLFVGIGFIRKKR